MCQGTCDAFASTKDTLAELHAALRRAALGGRACIVTCKQHAEGRNCPGNVVAAPCLAMIPPELWCELLAEGIDVRISIDFASCESCSLAGPEAEAIYARNIARAESWTGRTVGFQEALPASLEEGLIAGIMNAGADGSRRSMFTDVLEQLKDAASGSLRVRTDEKLRTLREQNQRLAAHQRLGLGNGTQFNAFAPHGRTKQIMGLSRKLLLQAIDNQPDIAERAQLPFPETGQTCNSCLLCTRTCPTGARLPNSETGKLTFDWRYCIGCGLCEQVCPNAAIALTPKTISQASC